MADDNNRPLPPWVPGAKPAGPPGGFQPQPTPTQHGQPTPPHAQPDPPQPAQTTSRRGVDLTSVGTLVLGLPSFAYSFLVVAWLTAVVTAGQLGIAMILVLLWIGSGAVIMNRSAEAMMARNIFGARPPTDSERANLEPLWNHVTSQAGVDGSRYQLWVEDRDELNALAAAGHIVTVTRRAIDAMPAHQLTAVLAHEMGHHLSGHTWTRLLMYWYSLPGRLFTRGVAALARFAIMFVPAAVRVATGVLRAFLAIIPFVGWILIPFAPLLVWLFIASLIAGVIGGAAAGLAQAGPLALIGIAVIIALVALPPWLSRQSELRADRAAADMGFGDPLVDVFEDWLRLGVQSPAPTGRARLFASHPPIDIRLAELKTYVGRTR